MFALQIAFAGVVAVASAASYFVYRKLAALERERHKIRYNPDLYVAGPEQHQWALSPHEIRHIWKRTLFLCNPGETPILVRSWTYRSAVTGASLLMQVYEKDRLGQEFLAECPLLIDGLSGRQLVFKLENASVKQIEIVYSTSAEKEKVLPLPVMLVGE